MQAVLLSMKVPATKTVAQCAKALLAWSVWLVSVSEMTYGLCFADLSVSRHTGHSIERHRLPAVPQYTIGCVMALPPHSTFLRPTIGRHQQSSLLVFSILFVILRLLRVWFRAVTDQRLADSWKSVWVIG